MLASIRDAISTAVTKAASHRHNFLAQRTVLHAESAQQENPYRAAKPLRVLDHALKPTAPLDDLMPGIQAQNGFILPPGYYPRAVYYPASQDIENPFPQVYAPPPPEKPENYMQCHTSPENWVDIRKIGCKYYSQAMWCTRDGREGLGWKKAWGKLDKYAVGGVGAAQACCECGGGARLSVVGRPSGESLDKRSLVSAWDRVPDPKARWFEENDFHLDVPPRPLRKIQAPEDSVPMPYKQVAPHDQVSQKYSRYFHEIYENSLRPDPRGFSVRFYTTPPKLCEGTLPKPVASQIVRSIDYGGSYGSASFLAVNVTPGDYAAVSMEKQSLSYPPSKLPLGGIWWQKWSGTIVVLDPGKYTWNLDMGWSSTSTLQVDGVEVLTEGQCAVLKKHGECTAMKCDWDSNSATCSASGKSRKVSLPSDNCPAGTFKTSPVLFGGDPRHSRVSLDIMPSSTTTIMSIPKGVKDLVLRVETESRADLQIYDPQSKRWILHFSLGILNNEQPTGTFHGQSMSFSGYGPGAQSVQIPGQIPSQYEVSMINYDANPATVKVTYTYGGVTPSPGKGKYLGCEKLDMSSAMKLLLKWSAKLKQTYSGQCDLAWKAVDIKYPGGLVTWNQWATVWPMAWAQEGADAAPGGAAGWQIGFAIVDADHNGAVSKAEFMNACGSAGPGPAPAPVASPVPGKPDKWKVNVEPYVGSPAPFPANNILPDIVGPLGTAPRVIDGVPAPPAAAAGLVQEAAGPAPAPAAGPAPFRNSLNLDAGTHCIEVLTMVTGSARDLKLTYAGPDTKNEAQIISGQVMHCDPIISACTKPKQDACTHFKKRCP
jgi:hypothetical protein